MSFLYQVGRTWYMGYKDRTGRWVQRSTRCQYKEAAKKHLERAERASADGKPDLPPISLREFLDFHLEAQRPALDPGTYDRYNFCLQNILKDGSPLAGLNISDVTIGACSQYVSWRLADGKSKATANKEIGWLKAALTEAARQDLVSWETVARIRDEINPKRLPALRKANRSRERVLMPKEIPILLEAAAINQNLHDALTLALWTGLRQENILQLTEPQFDFTCEPAVIRFDPDQMKSKVGHLVRLAPKAKDVLLSRWLGDPKKPDRHFFQDFRPAWKRIKAKLEEDGKLVNFRFHDLRRTYTTYRLAAGIDPKTVQDEVGHQDSRMTMDCYGKAVRDPGVLAWAIEHFRFPRDPLSFFEIAYTRRESLLSGGG